MNDWMDHDLNYLEWKSKYVCVFEYTKYEVRSMNKTRIGKRYAIRKKHKLQRRIRNV